MKGRVQVQVRKKKIQFSKVWVGEREKTKNESRVRFGFEGKKRREDMKKTVKSKQKLIMKKYLKKYMIFVVVEFHFISDYFHIKDFFSK